MNFHVFQKVLSSFELRVAKKTLECLFVFIHHVVGQCLCLWELSATDVTFIWLFPSVSSHMIH